MKYDVIIVGAGVMGAAAAYSLSKTGKKILLLDQFKINNKFNASNDYSRVFRYKYGSDEFYTKLAVESLKLWKKIEKEAKTKIYFQCGAVSLGVKKDKSYAMESFKSLKKLNLPVEFLDRKELKKRFPQFSTARFAILDPNGGVLEATKAVDTFVRLAKKQGVKVKEKTRVKYIGKNSVILEDGSVLGAKKIVVTSGFWVKKLVRKIPIRATKQQLVYFRPARKKDFEKTRFPIFNHFEKAGEDFYGFPMHGINAVKISNHAIGPEVNPDKANRTVDKEFVQACRNFFKKFIPALADAKVVKTKVCLYDVTPDENFIIDRLSDDIIVAAGFSGHGFKFAPLIGEIIKDLAIKGETSYDIRPFRMNRF